LTQEFWISIEDFWSLIKIRSKNDEFKFASIKSKFTQLSLKKKILSLLIFSIIILVISIVPEESETRYSQFVDILLMKIKSPRNIYE